MKTWSDGVVESWSVGSIRLRASLQYSNIPIPRLRFCLTLCAVLFALCCRVEAQQPTKVPRIGYQSAGNSEERQQAFRQGLRELGYVEGQNIVIEWRFAQGKPDQVPRNAAELVQLKIDVIVTGGSTDTRAAKGATSTIPIVIDE